MNPVSWTSYDLSDFLLFSDRVYWRMLAAYNEAMWPAQIVTLIAGVMMLAGLIRHGPLQSRLILLTLAAVWGWVAWAFFDQHYQTINWAAAHMVHVFALEALLLTSAALWPTPPRLAASNTPRDVAAIGILAAAVFVYPWLAWAGGQAWSSGDVFGIAPDPTAVATLAVIACWRQPVHWLFGLIPLFWCAVTGLTLYTLGAPHFFTAPALGLGALALVAMMGRLSHPAA